MTETTSPAPLEQPPTDDEARGQAFLHMLRDQFAAAALPSLLPHAVVRRDERGAIIAPNGRQPTGFTVGMDGGIIDWACEAAFDIAGRMVLARQGSLPRQLARQKAMMDAADAANSPAAELLKGPGAA